MPQKLPDVVAKDFAAYKAAEFIQLFLKDFPDYQVRLITPYGQENCRVIIVFQKEKGW